MLAVALAVAACQAGFSIYFTTLDDLVRRLRTADATGRFNRQLQAFLRPAVLVVDEVGYMPLDRAEANMFFQLPTHHPPLRTRHHDRHQQQSFTEWGGVLGDDVLATAILDRFLHHCDVIAINGPPTASKTASPWSPAQNPCHGHHPRTDTSGRTAHDT